MSDNRHKVRLIDGILYDPFYPSGPAPSPETVAHGLAYLCRYGGQVQRYYSVAEHSLWVALHLACGGSDNDQFKGAADAIAAGSYKDAFHYACEPERAPAALLGLVHDASEGCGLVDMPGPVGSREEMVAYKQAHDRCTTWICREWGIEESEELHAKVKEVDLAILGAEVAIRPKHATATAFAGSGEQFSPWPNLDLGVQHDLSVLNPKYVRRAWMAAYEALRGTVQR